MALLPTARAQPAGVPVLDLDGKGFGHGVGLSQWGARYMAEAGQDHSQILSTFYPGTTLSASPGSEIRVAVFTSSNGSTTLSFPNGGQVLSAPSGEQSEGFPVDIAPGDSAVVSFDGAAYHVSPVVHAQATSTAVAWHAPAASDDGCIPLLGKCPPTGGGGSGCTVLGCAGTTPSTTAPPPTDAPPDSAPPDDGAVAPPADGAPVDAPPTTSPGSATAAAPVWAAPAGGGTVGLDDRGRHYRGLLEATASGGPLRVVNQLDVETYLKGMAEVPGSWPLEAVGAQAVVARTYAMRAMAASGELCDYDLCQVYVGADNESPGQSAGVDATAGQVLTYADALATTVYSADAGGVSATTLEGFGSPDNGRYPYLTTVHYTTPNPLPWHDEIALSDIASRFGYGGTVDAVSIGDTGPSGRALTVVLKGSNGDKAVDGRQFASSLGLRSTLFTPTVGSAATAPAAPTEGEAMQVLPDDAAAMHAAASTVQRTRSAAEAAPSTQSTATITPPLPRSVSDLADRPVTWVALALLSLITAIALARADAGGLPVPAVAGGARRRLPAWTLWTWADVRRQTEALTERHGQRRLARERALAAAVVIPPVEPEAEAERIASRGAVDAWAPLFDDRGHPPRREPLRAARVEPAPRQGRAKLRVRRS